MNICPFLQVFGRVLSCPGLRLAVPVHAVARQVIQRDPVAEMPGGDALFAAIPRQIPRGGLVGCVDSIPRRRLPANSRQNRRRRSR